MSRALDENGLEMFSEAARVFATMDGSLCNSDGVLLKPQRDFSVSPTGSEAEPCRFLAFLPLDLGRSTYEIWDGTPAESAARTHLKRSGGCSCTSTPRRNVKLVLLENHARRLSSIAVFLLSAVVLISDWLHCSARMIIFPLVTTAP